MDGREARLAAKVGGKFPWSKMFVRTALMAAVTVCCAAGTARGQAMGKAAVDVGTTPTTNEQVAPIVTPAAAAPERERVSVADPKGSVAPAGAAAAPHINGLSMPGWPPLKEQVKEQVAAVMPTPATQLAPARVEKPIGDLAVPTPAMATPAAASVPAVEERKTPVSEIERRPIRPIAKEPSTTAPATAPVAVASNFDSFKGGLGNLAQVGAALAIVIGLILIGKALAKKFLPGAKTTGGKGVIEILARHPLAKNQSIVLVRIGSQIVALNQGRETSESVLVISEPGEVARILGQIEGTSPKSISAGFNNLLANARMDLERGDEDERDNDQEPDLRSMTPAHLDEQIDEMAAAKRQLMELRQHVRAVRDSMPRG